MTMFDKKLYVETFSALHASEDTLAEIRKLTSQTRKEAPHGIRPAVLLTALLVFLLSFAALAAGSRRMGGWVHHASVRSVEKMGLSCPNRLGEYRLSGPSPFRRIHAAPEESSVLKAWLDPDYTWMSAEYQNEAGQTLSLGFGKTDHPLWAYCFSYDAEAEVWLGAETDTGQKNTEKQDTESSAGSSGPDIKNVETTKYQGCTIYLAARNRSVEAHWVDPEIGLCLVLSSGPDWIQDEAERQNRDTACLAQREFLNLVKHVIDDNRTK